jgi:hypothetical protein
MVRRIVFLVMTAVIILATRTYSAEDRYMRLTRISYIQGNVSCQRSPETDWSAASVNMPLEPGDRIYTGPNGRIEIEFEDDSVLRLAENTDVEFLSLDDERVQLRMLVGIASLAVSSNSDFEINTPAAAFNIVRKGMYRFEIDENGVSDAIVRAGKLEAANNYFSHSVDARQRIRIRLGTDGNREIMAYDQRDAWDEWTDRRVLDRRAYASRQYLPDTVYMGAAELDRYGRWIYVGEYGWAWTPNSAGAYWSPYSVGRWCYRPLFGWTWVSYEPWGWLPYHYGRWQRHASYGWCWLPGEGFAFNFWSPGLVAFYQGAGWVSWGPLGPGDYYNIHQYHYNHRVYHYQMERLSGLHHRSPGDFFHRNTPGAFRTVDMDRFRSGAFHERSTDSRFGHITHPWKEGNLVRDRLDMKPSSVSYKPAPDRPSVRPRLDHDRPVVVRNEPPKEYGNRNQFNRITNPQIPSVPSRWSAGSGDRKSEERRNPERLGNSNRSRGSMDRQSQRPAVENREQRSPQTWPQSEGTRFGSPEKTAPSPAISNREPSVPRNNSRWQYERPVITVPPHPAEAPRPSQSPRENQNNSSQNRVVPEPRQGTSPPSDSNPSRWRTEGRSDQNPSSSEMRNERPSAQPSRINDRPQQERSAPAPNSERSPSRWGNDRNRGDSQNSQGQGRRGR